MAEKNEVSSKRGVLMSLFNKPKTDYVSEIAHLAIET